MCGSAWRIFHPGGGLKLDAEKITQLSPGHQRNLAEKKKI